MRVGRCLTAVIAAGAALLPPAAPAATAMARLLEWLPGEYDNHEQVWQAGLDGADPPPQGHYLFLPVAAPAVGERVFYVREYRDADPARVARLGLYRLVQGPDPAIARVEVFGFRDSAAWRDAHRDPGRFGELEPAALERAEGCDLLFRAVDGALQGTTNAGTCRAAGSDSAGGAPAVRDYRLDAELLVVRPLAGNPAAAQAATAGDGLLRHRRVRYYSGWGGVKQAGPGAAADDDAWHSAAGIVIHDEGQILPVLAADGTPSGWSVQLARLTYQETRVAVLKLGVIDDATGATVAYAWANPGAERIGINLRWAQFGLTLKPDPRFGF